MRRFGRTSAFATTLVATVAVLAPAAAADAQPAKSVRAVPSVPSVSSVHIAVRAVWPSVSTLGVVAVAGAITPAASTVHLALQRETGSHWQVVAWTVVGKSGRYSFLLRSPVQPAIWHLRVVRTTSAQVSGEVTERIVAASSGIVKAWGDNTDATLGDGTRTSSLRPVTVSGLSRVVAVASAEGAGYALRSDGTVWSWGDNAYGAQNYSNSPLTGLPDVPTRVAGVSGVTAIAASGGGTGYALRRDGTVWSWGFNGQGELGNGNEQDSGTARRISGLSHIVAISAGDADGYALRSDGSVWGWGDDGSHQLGADGTSFGGALRPVRVQGMSDAVAIAGGSDSLYLLRSDGTVWGAGEPFGAVDQSYPPPVGGVHELGQVPGLRAITAIAGGGSGGWALRADGTVVGWGVNSGGEIGNGTRVEHLTTPVVDPGLTKVRALCQDLGTTGCALRGDGSEWVWGDNRAGTLGDGTTRSRLTPGRVPGLTHVLAATQSEADGYAVVRP